MASGSEKLEFTTSIGATNTNSETITETEKIALEASVNFGVTFGKAENTGGEATLGAAMKESIELAL